MAGRPGCRPYSDRGRLLGSYAIRDSGCRCRGRKGKGKGEKGKGNSLLYPLAAKNPARTSPISVIRYGFLRTRFTPAESARVSKPEPPKPLAMRIGSAGF